MSDPLHRHLQAALAATPATPLAVAFSGGPDSSALLHALAQLPEARQRGLRALHVDHGLHADSPRWAEHCRVFCAALDVACDVLRVQVDRAGGVGLEAAARDARHAALAAQLHDDEWLLFAHHRDDQVETVLLKLLRGAGPDGLGGMRALRPFGRGQLWRPVL
ncbi:MAG: tRNA lysidine(34) synthetase TilS, partial [Rhodanobacter sp.]